MAEINIKEVKNVRRTLLRADKGEMFGALRGLPEGYYVKLIAVESYRPPVYMDMLTKSVDDLRPEDIEYLIEASKRRNGAVNLHIHRLVWRKYEVLSRQECLERIRTVARELSTVAEVLKVDLALT